jgi:hypothetical protein
MATYLLLWNPEKWKFEHYQQALIDAAQGGHYSRLPAIARNSISRDSAYTGDTDLPIGRLTF